MSDADGRAEATKPSSKAGIGETFTFAVLRRVLQALGLLWAVGITDTLSLPRNRWSDESDVAAHNNCDDTDE